MKNKLIVITILFVLLYSGCIKDPCNGREPSVIIYNEPLKIELHTLSGTNIFRELYNIDSLQIFENDTLISHKHFNRLDESDSVRIIEFSLATFSALNIWQNFNKTIEAHVVMKYNYLERDTLLFIGRPLESNDDCGNATWYDFVEIYFNSTLVSRVTNTTCFSCGQELSFQTEKP